jgi:hypothetical protein
VPPHSRQQRRERGVLRSCVPCSLASGRGFRGGWTVELGRENGNGIACPIARSERGGSKRAGERRRSDGDGDGICWS